MTQDEKKQKDIQRALDNYEIMQAHSTREQLMLETSFFMRCKTVLSWLGVKSKENKNEMLKEAVATLQELERRHEKILKDARYWENNSNYWEMMYNSLKEVDKQNEILRNIISDKHFKK